MLKPLLPEMTLDLDDDGGTVRVVGVRQNVDFHGTTVVLSPHAAPTTFILKSRVRIFVMDGR
ncbi:MAG: hypothetical protein ACLGI9_23750, partial [Thermoanaerobaculia bacterium]